MQGKKILFLGGSHSQVPAIKYAKKKGLYVIVADYLPDNPGQKYADEYHNVSTTDKEKVLELAHQKQIDAISSFASDPAALTHAFVSYKLNLVGNNVETIITFSNKNKFRHKLKEYEMLSPEFISSNQLEDLIKFYAQSGIEKMVLKPVDSSGSKGVFIIKSINDIKKYFPVSIKESFSNKVILEEFIQRKGPQIHGEGFVVNGKLEFLYLGDQYFDKEKQLIPFSTIVPSIEHKDFMGEAFEITRQFIEKSGFQNGGINVEIIRDVNDRLFLLEIGARSGGNFMPQLIKHATGVDLVKANVDILFEKKINFEIKKDNSFYYSQIILHSSKNGLLKKITLPREISSLVEQFLYYKTCEKINKYTNSRDVIGVNIVKINIKELKTNKYEELLYKKDIVDVISPENIKFESKKINRKKIIRYFVLNKDVFFSDLFKRVNIQEYAKKLEENAEHISLIVEGEIKGFCAFYANQEFGYISTISLSKYCQGKGYGKKMINKIMESLRNNKISILKLEVEKENKKAITFYKKIGFEITETKKESFIMQMNVNEYISYEK